MVPTAQAFRQPLNIRRFPRTKSQNITLALGRATSASTRHGRLWRLSHTPSSLPRGSVACRHPCCLDGPGLAHQLCRYDLALPNGRDVQHGYHSSVQQHRVGARVHDRLPFVQYGRTGCYRSGCHLEHRYHGRCDSCGKDRVEPFTPGHDLLGPHLCGRNSHMLHRSYGTGSRDWTGVGVLLGSCRMPAGVEHRRTVSATTEEQHERHIVDLVVSLYSISSVMSWTKTTPQRHGSNKS